MIVSGIYLLISIYLMIYMYLLRMHYETDLYIDCLGADACTCVDTCTGIQLHASQLLDIYICATAHTTRVKSKWPTIYLIQQ